MFEKKRSEQQNEVSSNFSQTFDNQQGRTSTNSNLIQPFFPMQSLLNQRTLSQASDQARNRNRKRVVNQNNFSQRPIAESINSTLNSKRRKKQKKDYSPFGGLELEAGLNLNFKPRALRKNQLNKNMEHGNLTQKGPFLKSLTNSDHDNFEIISPPSKSILPFNNVKSEGEYDDNSEYSFGDDDNASFKLVEQLFDDEEE